MQYTGLDVHKQFVVGATLDARGTLLRQWRFPTTPEALRKFAQQLGPDDAVCLESTTNAVAIHRLLAQSAGQVVLSNPLQTKAIASAKVKTDKVDATVLAQLLRADYLPGVWVPDDPTLRRRGVVSYRQALVRQRTQAKNRIHSLLHRNLVPLPDVSDLFGQRGRTFLQQVELPLDDRLQLDQELVLLQLFDHQVEQAGERLAHAAADDPRTALLLSLPGVSHQVAIGVLAALGTIDRFPDPKHLVSYFGLDPLGKRSADQPFGPTRISKRGRSHARWLLVEAATAAIRVPGPLQSFYARLRKRKGHSKAIVGTARKLAVLVWHLLTSGQPYAWAPPVRTHEKIRRLQILAGQPKLPSGSKKGQPSKGGRAAYEQRRQADHNLARLAQTQYEELVQQRALTDALRAELPAAGPEAVGTRALHPAREPREDTGASRARATHPAPCVGDGQRPTTTAPTAHPQAARSKPGG
jgi:transposase